jgi:serine/threonine protein kinase
MPSSAEDTDMTASSSLSLVGDSVLAKREPAVTEAPPAKRSLMPVTLSLSIDTSAEFFGPDLTHIPTLENVSPSSTVSSTFALSTPHGTVDISDETLGSGKQGTVTAGQWTPKGSDKGQDCIIKETRLYGLKEEEGLYEAFFQTRCSHLDNVVPLLSSGQYRDSQYLIMPKFPKSLEKESPVHYQTSDDVSVAFARDICRGLKGIHDTGIVHCDIKPANIMLDGDRHYIGDFGNAKEAGSDIQTGTVWYLPSGEINSPKTDMYMFGVTFGEVCLGLKFDSKDHMVNTSIKMTRRFRVEAERLHQALVDSGSYEALSMYFDDSLKVHTNDNSALANSVATICSAADAIPFERQLVRVDFLLHLLDAEESRLTSTSAFDHPYIQER